MSAHVPASRHPVAAALVAKKRDTNDDDGGCEGDDDDDTGTLTETRAVTSAEEGDGGDDGDNDGENGVEESDSEDEDEDDDDDDDEEEEEPHFKLFSLTKDVPSLYRRNDATSCFLTAGDKMVRTMFSASNVINSSFADNKHLVDRRDSQW